MTKQHKQHKQHKHHDIAVVGATGAAGRVMMLVLEEATYIPIKNVFPLASQKSQGKRLGFRGEKICVENLVNFDFSKASIVIFVASEYISKSYIPKATEAGCHIIDCSSFSSSNIEIPLIVPEINAHNMRKADTIVKIVTSPHPVTVQLAIVLKPLHNIVRMRRVIITVFSATSGSGKDAMDELFEHTKKRLVGEVIEPKVLSKSIVFNVIPHVGKACLNGYSSEEKRIMHEMERLFGYDDGGVDGGNGVSFTVTCVQVPVFVGHGTAINVEFDDDISASMAREILDGIDDISVIDDSKVAEYTTPIECVEQYDIYVSRIRNDKSTSNALNMWVVSDNLRRGVAWNAVQIVELMILLN